MTTTEQRDHQPRVTDLDLSDAQPAELVAEIQRLRALVADRDRQLAEKTRELSVMGRRVDDLLDRESMHIYAPDMECLTTAAALERHGKPRAQHIDRLEVTAPRIERGAWEGFDR
jgi:hypothetical protein